MHSFMFGFVYESNWLFTYLVLIALCSCVALFQPSMAVFQQISYIILRVLFRRSTPLHGAFWQLNVEQPVGYQRLASQWCWDVQLLQSHDLFVYLSLQANRSRWVYCKIPYDKTPSTSACRTTFNCFASDSSVYVSLVDRGNIGWKSWKLIARTISPAPSLFVAKRRSSYSQWNMEKFGESDVG